MANLNKSQLWKAMKEPIPERTCGNCVHDTIGDCALFKSNECSNPSSKSEISGIKWKYDGKT